MVERLKEAVSKARAARQMVAPAQSGETPPRPIQHDEASQPAAKPVAAPQPSWSSLKEIVLDPKQLRRKRIISHEKSDPAHMSIDLLRTRLIKIFRDNGWSRLAITSPTKGCGKTVISLNLALSLSRQREFRTLLFDCDLRSPNVARSLGLRSHHAMEWFLKGDAAADNFLLRVGDNLALGLNTERVRESAELMQSDQAADKIDSLVGELAPDAVIFDLPPILMCDDTMAFLPNVDCVLLVGAAGETKPAEIEECEAMLSGHANVVGVLLNKARQTSKAHYYSG